MMKPNNMLLLNAHTCIRTKFSVTSAHHRMTPVGDVSPCTSQPTIISQYVTDVAQCP